jgi:tripartite ATP-independent transporter DctM subunit
MTPFLISLAIFVLMLVIGIPVGICLGITGLIGVIILGVPLEVVAQRIFTGLDSFPLLCIPFFIIAGEIMNRAQITDRIIHFSDILVGRFRGAMAQANVVASMFFGGITGAAAADVAALGSILIPAMKKSGYDPPFSAAVTAASSLQGPIIPPSILAVIYGATMGESIGALFAAGIPIGILIGLSDMIIVAVLAVKRKYPKQVIKVGFKDFFRIFANASVALLMPVIIIGGILAGVFTPTEAAAVAVGYAFFVGIFILKTLRLKDIPQILANAGLSTGVVFLLLATARLYSWILSTNRIPVLISNSILSLTSDPIMVILLINVILLLVGCVMDPGAAIIMLAPVLAPLAIKVGVHPIQFGLIMIVNLCLGLITPPVGLCLFLLLNIVILFIVSYVKPLVLWAPKIFGFL